MRKDLLRISKLRKEAIRAIGEAMDAVSEAGGTQVIVTVDAEVYAYVWELLEKGNYDATKATRNRILLKWKRQ